MSTNEIDPGEGRPVPPHRSGGGVSRGAQQPEGQSFNVITNDAFVKDRPWVCCKQPMFLGRNKDLIPLIAICDKKLGHSGVHRGRFDGSTYFWKDLSKQATDHKRRQRDAAIRRQQERLDAEAATNATKASEPPAEAVK